MQNSHTLSSRNFAINQGAMRNLISEGTGSGFVESMSVPYQVVPSVWGYWSHALREGYFSTSGVPFIFTKNDIDSLEVPLSIALGNKVGLVLAALSPAFVLNIVRTAFGLNISETADVFGITRQTAYQWMKLTNMEQVRSHENRERIKQIYKAAQLWQKQLQLKGRWLYALLPTGYTVLDLLKSHQVDLDALQSAYQVLSASTADRRREEGERATQAATALADAFAGLSAGRKARKA